MSGRTIGTREEWLAAREELLAREKEHTRLGDELARRRRELPWVRVEKEYRFDTDDGERALAELFDGRGQLLVYHFMFGPSYQAGCPVNSSIADAVDGVLPHLRARDVSLVFVSQAPLEKLQAYKRRMGWSFPWVSSARTDFNFDLGFSHTEEQGREAVARMTGTGLPPIVEHNARSAGTDVAGYLTESPGFSTFVLDDGTVHHAYSTSWRGLEFLMGYYPILDRAPKGRDEGEAWQLWIRRHDELPEDAMSERSRGTTIVVGASHGLGRGIATAFAEAGAPVLAVSRTAAAFAEPSNGAGTIHPEVADAADATAAAGLLDRHEPEALILVAGASPHMRPLQQHTWETFSVNWQSDVRIAFHWLREALLKPLRPGSRVVVFSSAAALNGSPLSGGYAGAKATQRFITGYAQDEAARAGLGITFTTVLPQFAPQTGVGRPAVQAYAARVGQSVEDFLHRLPFPLLTPEIAGSAVVELVRAEPASVAPAYVLSGAGLQKLP